LPRAISATDKGLAPLNLRFASLRLQNLASLAFEASARNDGLGKLFFETGFVLSRCPSDARPFRTVTEGALRDEVQGVEVELGMVFRQS
jgi:hypothetical protein